MADLPTRVDVVGTGISTAGLDETVDLILHPGEQGLGVAVCNVHSVMSARRDSSLRAALSAADVATADGIPLVWALRAAGQPNQERVDGLTLFWATIEAGLPEATGHFFYGNTEATLERITARLRRDYPEIAIAGTLSPPFRSLTEHEQRDHLDVIRRSGADVVWVGLGVPKQERWIAEASPHLKGVALVGIGAVFDWVAGNVAKAPEWMQRAGLEWLYRLIREPRRLWQRYIWNNPAFLVLLVSQLGRARLRQR
jgi:N-acetylglucosaminyldiphosphoundecaprenol N-acetyl-beta-D-mannosaminyltransferase